MADELKIWGKVVEVLPMQSGTGNNGSWEKQDFVIETGGQYPKKACFTCFGKMVDSVPTKGQEVTVYFNIEAREYQGKYFNNVNAWKVEVTSGEKAKRPLDPKKNEFEPYDEARDKPKNTIEDGDFPF